MRGIYGQMIEMVVGALSSPLGFFASLEDDSVNVALVLSALFSGRPMVAHTGCASFVALWWVLHFGGTRGHALRIVPLSLHCGWCSHSAGREGQPYGVVPLSLHCGWRCLSAGREAPPYGFVPR